MTANVSIGKSPLQVPANAVSEMPLGRSKKGNAASFFSGGKS